MQVKKVFNNNVILADENGKEVVLVGKGLGFQKKEGEFVDETLADKLYQPVDERWSGLFNEMLEDISAQYVEISSQIINIAEQKLQTKFNSYVLISLSDHIHFAVERLKKDIIIKNELLWETKRFYPQEYQVGKEALEIIQDKLNVNLPIDEAGFIALKFIEKRTGNNENAIKITQLIGDILTMVQYQLQVALDENSISYQRFIIHLRYFVERILKDDTNDNGNEFDQEMQEHILKKYPQAYKCTQKIQDFIEKTLNKSVSNNEQIYLTIHIQRIISEIS